MPTDIKGAQDNINMIEKIITIESRLHVSEESRSYHQVLYNSPQHLQSYPARCLSQYYLYPTNYATSNHYNDHTSIPNKRLGLADASIRTNPFRLKLNNLDSQNLRHNQEFYPESISCNYMS